MAGIYEIWRDPTKDRDDDSAWLRTCTVITTEATDAAGHIHDRMPMVIRREAVDAWLDPELTDPEQALELLAVTEADAAGGVRGVDRGEQRAEQPSRAASEPIPAERDPDARRAGPGHAALTAMPSHDRCRSTTPQGPGRCFVDPADGADVRCWCSDTAPGAGHAADLRAAGPAAARAGRHRGAVRAALADRRPPGRRAARPRSTRPGWPPSAGSATRPWARAGCSSAAAAPEPGWPAGPRPALEAAGVVCLAFPAAPARPAREVPGPGAARPPACRGWCCRAPRTPSARPDEIRAAIGDGPRDPRWSSCPVPTTAYRVAKAAPFTAGRPARRGCWPRLAAFVGWVGEYQRVARVAARHAHVRRPVRRAVAVRVGRRYSRT